MKENKTQEIMKCIFCNEKESLLNIEQPDVTENIFSICMDCMIKGVNNLLSK